MIQVKHIKKITSLLLILVTALVLVACGKKDAVPYGNVSEDTYISVGDKIVTNKELYDSLRKQSATTLSTLINEELFKSYTSSALLLLEVEIKNVVEGSEQEWAHKLFDELVNQAIFSTTDLETIKSMDALRTDLAITKYVDTLFVNNPSIDKSALKASIEAKLEGDSIATNYSTIAELKNIYAIEIGKRMYARTVLDKEVVDEDSSNFVKDTNVITYYKNNVLGRHDVNVFYFSFLSLAEANAALMNFNVKSDSRGNWYNIPDVRQLSGFAGLAENREYVMGIIEKVNLKDKLTLDSNGEVTATLISDQDYKKFYDSYSPSSQRETALDNESVLELFVNLNNLVNNNNLQVDNGTIVDFDGTKTYDELNTLNSSFRSFIYSNLTVEKPYSTLRSVGNYRYLVYKLEKDPAYIDLVSPTKDDDNNEKWVTIEELKEKVADSKDGEKFKQEILAAYEKANNNGSIDWTILEENIKADIATWQKKTVDAMLTSSYTNTKVNEVLKEAKIEIYDLLVRTFYNQNATTKATGKNKSGSIIASVNVKLNDEEKKFDILVDNLYAKLEKTSGLSTALDLVTSKVLLNDRDTIDSKKYKEFEEQYKTLISNFSNDQFASAGYPASIGREAFQILIFGTTNKKEAIELGYVIPELRTNYLSDYDKHLGSVDIYEKLALFAGRQYTNYKGLNVSHLLVYLDENGDGTPDDPEEFFKKNPTRETEIKDAIVSLYAKVLSELETKDGIETGLTAIATEFQNSARIKLYNDENSIWQEYRKLGLNLKFETIGNEITNTSNFLTNSSTLDTVFYNRAIYLHDLIQNVINDETETDKVVNDGVPYLDFAGNNLNVITAPEALTSDYLAKNNGDTPGVMSSFGFHFILVTSLNEKSSAKYEETNEDYTVTIDEKEYSINNSSDTISKGQVEYYIRGNKLDDGVLVPTSVKTAFTKYYDPIIDLYKNSYMQSEVLYSFIKDDLNLHGKEELFKALTAINRSNFFTYLNGIDTNYDALYGDWFKQFGLE